jgi:hypothetical protein
MENKTVCIGICATVAAAVESRFQARNKETSESLG